MLSSAADRGAFKYLKMYTTSGGMNLSTVIISYIAMILEGEGYIHHCLHTVQEQCIHMHCHLETTGASCNSRGTYKNLLLH